VPEGNRFLMLAKESVKKAPRLLKVPEGSESMDPRLLAALHDLLVTLIVGSDENDWIAGHQLMFTLSFGMVKLYLLLSNSRRPL
jgi:hypothetical protein